jgi:hypothetical protein
MGQLAFPLTRVRLVQVHEEGRHDEEERIRHSVEELGDERTEYVVCLAPVHWGAAAGKMLHKHRADKRQVLKDNFVLG